ncbi:MAG: hypothetical protein HUU15_07520, partial [Candidatus Brocadiae bacterium]|nr:hypothetical protein [Candidatus Brocadiia bacterium]
SAVECARLLAALGHPAPAPRKALGADYAAALKAALARKNPWPVLTGLEILRRHDTWPMIADAAEASTNAMAFADAVETLATSEDVPRLLRMVSAKDPALAEAAGAAVFRLARREDDPAIRKVLDGRPGEAVVLYLQGALARFGDAAALALLRATLAGEDSALAYHGAAILGSLGFSAHIAALENHAETVPALTVWRIVPRAPRGWGAVFSNSPDTAAETTRARALNLHGEPERVSGLHETTGLWDALYRLPRTPEESRVCGAGWVLRIAKLATADDESGDWSSWISSGLGYDLFGGEERLRAHAARNEAAFALADLREFQAGATAAAQTRTLVVQNGNAWARVLCTAAPAVGDLTDNVLHLPFAFTWDTAHGHDGSLAGAIGQISLQISLSGLVPEATIRIPGHPVLQGRVRTAGESLLWVDADLPVLPDGEGVGAGTVVPVEALAAGTVTLHLRAEGSAASMTFPLALLIPPAVDKPDLVAAELTLEPRVPKPGEEVFLHLRTRNIGRTPDTDALLNVRFQVLNPQTGEGRRTIDVRLTEAKGWRAGEWRTFEARPTAIRGWYMNAWSPTWTLELGDTRILAVVDAENRLEEMAEDNNTVEVEVPLYTGDAEGKSLAEQEFLERARAILGKVGDARGEEDAREAGREALALFARAKFSTPELEFSKRHLQAAVETQVHRIRVRGALARARELAKDPGPNSGRLRDLIVELTDAETDLLDSGIPAKEDTITWWRNRTQLAANQAGAAADYAELAGILDGPAGESADRLRKIGDNLNRLDGALQNIRYLRDRADGGAYDNADPIEGTCSLFAGGHPGLSKLHQAMFKAEIDYIDRGFRKEAGALDALADLISGKPGAQERLDTAVRDVETHVTAGPFNEEARKEILQGAVKDVPVIGKLLDSIWSWK